jgi:Protein of unknown function (DUF5672)
MAMLKLLSITLVMVETREHELARLAVEDCLRVAEFGDVVIVTDKPEQFDGLSCNPRFHTVSDWPTKEGWARSMWYDIPPLVRTSHILAIQWDAWICDTMMWRDEFLNYDYIGAPWWYKDGKNVGNSGFCLKSTRLARYLAKNRDIYPCDTSIEDDLLCRKYRPKLEDVGFRWAPERIACDFSFEGCAGNKPTKHFGFHAAFNFGWVLEHDRLLERARLMLKSPYIRESYIMKAFCEKNPDIIKELLDEKEPSDLIEVVN